MDDIASLYERDTHERLSRSQRNQLYGYEQCGPCPFGCGAKDAFHVYPQANYVPGIGYLGWFDCMDSSKGRGGCGCKGDMIRYMELRRNLDFFAACDELGVDAFVLLDYRSKTTGLPYASQPGPEYVQTKKLSEISEQWQQNAYELARYASGQLNESEEALNYLHERGLQNSTIKRHLLGFYPEYKKVSIKLWGASHSGFIRIPRGIVIPWFDDNNRVMCVRFRRLPSDESDQAKEFYGVDEKTGEIGRYKALLGSVSTLLYNGDSLLPGCDAALFEGEFDALLAEQETNRCACVATGSTSWGRSPQSIRKLQTCDTVLICFDADKGGHKAVTTWRKILSNARPWVPLWGDVSDIHLQGMNLDEWLTLGFEYIPEDQAQAVLVQAVQVVESVLDQVPCPDLEDEEESEQDLADVCSKCDRQVEHYDENGTAYCGLHWYQQTDEERQQWGIQQMLAITGGTGERIASKDIPAFKERQLLKLRAALRACEPALTQKQVLMCAHANCKKPVLPEMIWCEGHQYAQEIMNYGESCQYREVRINQFVTILSGQHNWQAYAERVEERRMKDVKKAMKRYFGF